ncbi:hypothetical protein GGX14DRAFT_400494 [Mycena pura]|uniref:Ribonuclease H1 N-terminal domain-containing protein n=1 Tax=Mycena pura TaxID=153505 RepID=A0AAD6V629_9AGAR|nr:hypothetical protein GGX14DRAFT_400494 [Mycena pura]
MAVIDNPTLVRLTRLYVHTIAVAEAEAQWKIGEINLIFHFEGVLYIVSAMMHNTLTTELEQTVQFYPRRGYEGRRGSADFTFYVVQRGYCPGIYTHWEDAAPQVTGFKNCCYKKYTGWDAAVAAWDNSRRPMTPRRPITPPRHILSPPITSPQVRAEGDSIARHSSSSKNIAGKRSAPAPATTGNRGRSRDDPRQPAHDYRLAMSSSSVPATSTCAKKLLYVYSGGDASTIYTDEQMASAVARRGLEDGTFHALDITPRLSDAMERATDSALQVVYVSDVESD